ncbi:hypothetical protein AJ78_04199 [Emergomyces pasteurianus Ep9510]|uniref:25S rRNA (uridine-N(3))-methyltransferase BMT5-like domain-containing protein n=1 Tax=Emergomyces pasteurianus Ep9510 TaxID=1447872 RepID=A0A1J9PHQ7_9EURO|nr:hypothetical protein AJ78_04199 [Emergomyces pasteurianus Ep9510]
MGKSKKPRIANFHHHDRPKSRSSTAAPSSGTGAGAGPRKMKSFSRVSTTPVPSKGGKRMGNGSGGSAKDKTSLNPTGKANAIGQNRPPTIPFQKGDRILLVGEGDFSFALSLATHHGCKNLLATSFDAEQALYEKYPQAKLHIEKLCASGSETCSSSPRTLKRRRGENEGSEDEGNDSEEKEKEQEKEEPEKLYKDQNRQDKALDKPINTTTQGATKRVPKVLFSIDARKLGSGAAGGGKAIRNGFPRTIPYSSSNKDRSGQRQWKGADGSPSHQKQQQQIASGGPWDIICFNFPHVGGLSTDVNRQTRANQELLVSFFKACVPLLSEPAASTTSQDRENEGGGHGEWEEGWPDSDFDSDSDSAATDHHMPKRDKPTARTTPGQILVSLFEGEPYTLWNIRDLARHAGLRVVTSFRFPWASYPGYMHARTIGEIEKKNGGAGRGGWRGEDREARMFVFERKGAEGVGGGAGGQRRKKSGYGKGGDIGDNEDDDSD